MTKCYGVEDHCVIFFAFIEIKFCAIHDNSGKNIFPPALTFHSNKKYKFQRNNKLQSMLPHSVMIIWKALVYETNQKELFNAQKNIE